jgi:glycosyltransferase involved in cell wall biosynthesis
MKLIIQIPCYNEEATVAMTLSALPRQVSGFDQVEWLVIDDGSDDKTVEVALAHGVDHIVRLPRNQGLTKVFIAGLDACLKLGADVIVNTDADNQYYAGDIPKLIEPILSGNAEIVIGARSINDIKHFSFFKKLLQKFGSFIVRIVSKTDIPDAPSGFRAMSRDAAMRLNVFNDYTYTLETIIQAGQKGMAISSIPVRTNTDLRPSRLMRSIPSYIRRSALTIIRIFMTYNSFRFFAVPGAISLASGFLIGLRFLYYYSTGNGSGHIQSLILASFLMGSGFVLIMAGLLADLISVNRKLLEEIQYKIRKMENKKDAE